MWCVCGVCVAGKRLAHTHGALVTLREGRTLVKLPMASHLPGLPPLDDQSLPPGLAINPIEIALVLVSPTP
jgi:hypothetical protein